MYIGTVAVKQYEGFSKKLKVRLPHNSNEIKTPSQSGICTPTIMFALFTITKTWKQAKCPSVD